jgi:hypothetical protein
MSRIATDGNYLFDSDINSLCDGVAGNGVVSGMAVTENDAGADMSVDVASGVYVANGTLVTYAGGNVVITAADGSNPRKDIIIADSSGNITCVAGTPAAAAPVGNTGTQTYTPAPPDITTNKIILAEVWVGTSVATIVNANITDRRINLSLANVSNFQGKNAIINGSMRVAQRGTSFTSATTPANSDDTYLLDRWILLSDGNDIVDVSQVTTPVPTGSYSAACFDIETEDKKWGILQVLEAKDSARFIGGTVSLQFKAAMATGDTNTLLRAAVLSWSSTADTVTSDVVNAWGAEGTNPTVVANWTFENTPAALDALTASYQTYKIEGIAIDTASTTNIAIFIWSDDMTNAVGDLVYITDVQLEPGSVSTSFEFRHYVQELALCQRYYCFRPDQGGAGIAISTAIVVCNIGYVVPMRVIPTVVISNNNVANHMRRIDTGADVTVNTVVIPTVLDALKYVYDSGSTPFVAGLGYDLGFTASAEL